MGLDEWWTAAGDLLVGARCHGCGRPGTGCCADCIASLAEPVRRVRRDRVELPPTWAAGSHEGPRRGLVVSYKDEAAWSLSRVLGDELARAVAAAVLECDAGAVVLVPAPSAPARVRERGLDTTATLARRAAERLSRLGVATKVDPCLAQRPGVGDQVGLGAGERLENLRARLVCRGPPVGRVVLVDDIVTTGATLAEGARCLRETGADVVAAAAVSARGWE